jgi:hypothetical protein
MDVPQAEPLVSAVQLKPAALAQVRPCGEGILMDRVTHRRSSLQRLEAVLLPQSRLQRSYSRLLAF